jgi:predicted house-cleaning noncanonical NTP pyrophosphatase (MazG superfamily)
MEKLIRDKIHITSHPEYKNMKIRKVQDTLEHIRFLLLKIQEEQKEFDTANIDTKIEEAGDLLEVYDTLIDIYTNTGNQE